MKQDRSDERLHAWVDGELEPAEEEELRRELEHDPELRRRVEAVVRLKQLVRVRYRPTSVPSRAMGTRLRERLTLEGIRRSWYRQPSSLAAAASLVIVIPLVFFLFQGPDEGLHARIVEATTLSLPETPPPGVEDWDHVAQLLVQYGVDAELPDFRRTPVRVARCNPVRFEGATVARVVGCLLRENGEAGEPVAILFFPGVKLGPVKGFCHCRTLADRVVLCRQYNGSLVSIVVGKGGAVGERLASRLLEDAFAAREKLRSTPDAPRK